MTRRGTAIEDLRLKDPVNTGILFSAKFAEWEAVINAGATLDELYKWEMGEYPPWFKARVLIWYERHILKEAHTAEAQVDKVNKKR